VKKAIQFVKENPIPLVTIFVGFLLLYFSGTQQKWPTLIAGTLIAELVMTMVIQSMRTGTRKWLWALNLVIGAILMGIDIFLIPDRIRLPDHVLLTVGFVMIVTYIIFSD
jgi:hypothetical protein